MQNYHVLIVAKCIVNIQVNETEHYSKTVLIVAKCIVNNKYVFKNFIPIPVLIVAKCIVNEETKGFETQNIDESEIVLARGNEITLKKIELSRTHIVIGAEIGKVK